jgi:hypothetical protein
VENKVDSSRDYIYRAGNRKENIAQEGVLRGRQL